MAASSLAPEIAAELRPGAYLTDGRDLFAILSIAEGDRRDPLVTYEDCRTLELLVCPLTELRSRRLELVRPAATA